MTPSRRDPGGDPVSLGFWPSKRGRDRRASNGDVWKGIELRLRECTNSIASCRHCVMSERLLREDAAWLNRTIV